MSKIKSSRSWLASRVQILDNWCCRGFHREPIGDHRSINAWDLAYRFSKHDRDTVADELGHPAAATRRLLSAPEHSTIIPAATAALAPECRGECPTDLLAAYAPEKASPRPSDLSEMLSPRAMKPPRRDRRRRGSGSPLFNTTSENPARRKANAAEGQSRIQFTEMLYFGLARQEGGDTRERLHQVRRIPGTRIVR